MPAPETLRVAVLGASGYIGGELLRLLAPHPNVAALRAFSAGRAGKSWSDVHPALAHVRAGMFEAPAPGEAARWADVVFLALPHGQSQAMIGPLLEAQPRLVIDTAADFRVRDRALYEASYGEHVAFELTEQFVYGLADTLGAELSGARRIAAPGCFATATLLALYPLARAGLLAGMPVAFAVTGSSGAGAEPKRTTHHPVRAHNFFAYALDGHRHEAEIADQLRRWTGAPDRCTLVTHSAPLVRGIHATVHVRLQRPLADPLALYRTAYDAKPFICVLEQPPELVAVVGTNFAHLHVSTRANGDDLLVTCAIDNLVKGGAGQAVQAMNLALGLPEVAGLTFGGLYPC